MVTDLTPQVDELWAGNELHGPDGVRYSRRSSRARRAACEERIGTGSPLVLFWWADGRVEWHDGGPDAQRRWREVRRDVTSQEPRPAEDVVWTAGVWDDGAGHELVLLTGHC